MNSKAKKNEYFTRKSNIVAINGKIADKNAQITELKTEIAETEAAIASTSKRLEIEERERTLSSPLAKITMTLEEFRVSQAHIAEWRKKLPELNAALEYLNQELKILQNDLVRERPFLVAARSEILANLVDTELKEFAAVSGESFKNLVLAIIANSGKNRPYSRVQYQAYKEDFYKSICETILPRVFGNDIPDAHEAGKILNAIFENEREAA